MSAAGWRPCAVVLAVLLGVLVWRLVAGPAGPDPGTLAAMLRHPDPQDFNQHIVQALRLPRALGVALAGGCLGLAGYVLQIALRNPLAEPQLLGLNAGASLAMVAATAFPMGLGEGVSRPLLAAFGALLCFALVMSLGQSRNHDPLRLIFCGLAVSALANAASSALLLLDSETLEELRFWLIGDGAAATRAVLLPALPVAAAGLALGALALRGLRVLMLGEAVAQGLGLRVRRARVLALLASAALSGAAVSIVGPIGFIGMIAPLLWPDALTRPRASAMACVALTGAALLMLADLAASYLFYPQELPTGAITGLLGAPVFLALCLRKSA